MATGFEGVTASTRCGVEGALEVRMWSMLVSAVVVLGGSSSEAASREVLVTLGTGAVAQRGLGPQVYGRLGVMGERLGLEGGAREAGMGTQWTMGSGRVAAVDGRFIGSVDLVARLQTGPVVWRAGLAHHHALDGDAMRADPVGGLLGVAEDITHRSGVALAMERSLPLSALLPIDPSGVVGDGRLVGALCADWMPTGAGPAWTGWVETGIQLAF